MTQPYLIESRRARAARRGRVERTYEEAELAVVTAELDRRRERRVGERERGRRDDGGLRCDARREVSRGFAVFDCVFATFRGSARRCVGVHRARVMEEN